MDFLLIVVISLAVLGAVAAILSRGDTDEPVQQKEGDCGSCSSRAECKLADLVDKSRKACHLLLVLFVLASCSTKNNTAKSRWWHSFNARYNTYFNGSQAFIEGSLEKEQGNKDNYTELIPLYTVGNKQSRDLGKGNFDRAIEKSEKAIKRHSIKARPQWNKSRRKTQKDIEWLNRREYNPFLWRAWLLMGKSQFQKGEFEEAAATFSYMSRLYQTHQRHCPRLAGKELHGAGLALRCRGHHDQATARHDALSRCHRLGLHLCRLLYPQPAL